MSRGPVVIVLVKSCPKTQFGGNRIAILLVQNIIRNIYA